MKGIREQREMFDRMRDPMNGIRELLASWQHQQVALQNTMQSLVGWRTDFRTALGLSSGALGPSAATVPARLMEIAETLDTPSIQALGHYQAGLARQTAGPLIDAIADDTTDDETPFVAAWNWGTSHPWKVVHYYPTVWLKALEVLTAGGFAAAAVAQGSAPTTPVLLVVVFVVCTAEFGLLLSRPGGPEGDDHGGSAFERRAALTLNVRAPRSGSTSKRSNVAEALIRPMATGR